MGRRDDMDPEIATLARIECEEVYSDEDLFDYFGFPPESPRPLVVEPFPSDEIPF